MNDNINESEENATNEETPTNDTKPRTFLSWLAAAALIGVIVIVALVWINAKTATAAPEPAAAENKETPSETTGVALTPELLAAASISTAAVVDRSAVTRLMVSGTVETNPERVGLATPLIGGRLEKIRFGVGDFVGKGAVMAMISSPQAAQMHGKMHEARTHYELAQRNYARVTKPENRVSYIQAKARHDEAEATLKRVKRLIELGAGAGKDLIAAETNYKSARAELDFQSNISINREIQEAKAELETSRIDMQHIEDEMASLGIETHAGGADDHHGDTSLVPLIAPMSGVVTERKFNEGAGIEPATPVFAIADPSSVLVIANVPQSVSGQLVVGTPAEITSAVSGRLTGRVSYIDPQLDETTRTTRVRIEVANPGGRLRAGMFTEVSLQNTASTTNEIAVPTEAVQRTGGKNVVFIPRTGEPGTFDVREIETGAESDGFIHVVRGLSVGETVVTAGSFVLKTQLEKASLEEE